MGGGSGARLVRHPVLPADKVADGAEPFFEQSSERLRRVRTGDRPVMVADEHLFNAARLEIAQQPQRFLKKPRVDRALRHEHIVQRKDRPLEHGQLSPNRDRNSVELGKSVSVRVDIGGLSVIKKTKTITNYN